MPRRLHQIRLEANAQCMHCEKPFDRPYERVPEVEGTSGNVVLKCQHCGLLTVFQEIEDLQDGTI